MLQDRRRAFASLLVVAVALVVLGAPLSRAQDDPIGDLFTTTTQPSATSAPTTTAPPPDQAPAGAEDPKGDGVPVSDEGITVPPEAQRIIDAVKRTGSSSNGPLLTALSELVALGMPQDEAYHVGLGRFPVAGPARYSHDWLYPRYGPGFRFHLGTDVFAAQGTPVRAPVDGVALSGEDELGGLWVKVQMPDRTYFYLAHLAGLPVGFTSGMPVRTGDIVGFVGDSGNARGGSPHLHVGIYPKGGPAVDPKPVLDQFLADANANVPRLLEQWRATHPASPAAVPLVSEEARLLRPTLATQVLHARLSGDRLPSPVLYVIGADPAAGAGVVLQRTLDDLAASVDWEDRAAAGSA